MKKVFVMLLFFVLFFSFSSTTTHTASAAGCALIQSDLKPGTKVLKVSREVDPNSKTAIITKDSNDIVLRGLIEFANECFDEKGKPVNGKTPSIKASTDTGISAVLSPTGVFHGISINIGADSCKQTASNALITSWMCSFEKVELAGATGTTIKTIKFPKIEFQISSSDPDAIAAFKSRKTTIAFDDQNVTQSTSDCKVTGVSAQFITNKKSRIFTANDAGTAILDGEYARIIFSFDLCGGSKVALYVQNVNSEAYSKVVQKNLEDTPLFGTSISWLYKAKSWFDGLSETFGLKTADVRDFFSNTITVDKSTQYFDFKPYFGIDMCGIYPDSPQFTGYKSYRCIASIYAEANGSSYRGGLLFYYHVLVPEKLKAEELKIQPVIVGSDIKGTDLGTFGSTGIKEGFSWDPCYDPKDKQMVTYPELKGLNSAETGVKIKDLKPEQIAAGLDECYTLLSNLPIKIEGESDPVSSKIGYAPARDSKGVIIPGLFKTVIVGRFYVGDFIIYLFKLLVGISALVAVAVLIYIGIAIASNKENPYQLKVLKEWLGRVFGAIIIILGSYLILGVIDPKLTDFGFGIDKFNLSEQGFVYDEYEAYDQVTKSGTVKNFGKNTSQGGAYFDDVKKILQEKEAANKLYNLKEGMTKHDVSVQLPSNGSYQVDLQLGYKLLMMIKDLQSQNIAGTRITEAFPPSRVHANNCHKTGECVDFNIDDHSEANVKKVLAAAKKQGLHAVFETYDNQKPNYPRLKTPTDVQYFGVDPKTGKYWISAPHFSIYLN